MFRDLLKFILEGYYGECQKRKPNQESSVVETPTGLETSILEERKKCSEEGNKKCQTQ